MKTQSKKNLHCALLTFQKEDFLMPMMLIVKLISLSLEEMKNFSEQHQTPWINTLHWQQKIIPVTTVNLAKPPQKLYYPKIAVFHALFSPDLKNQPYIGIIFEEIPQKINLKPENLTWIDENEKKAKLFYQQEERIVTLLDLNKLCQMVEQNLNIPK